MLPVMNEAGLLVLVQVEKELRDICNDMLDVLDKHLIPSANTGESKVFYYKMYVIYCYLSLIKLCTAQWINRDSKASRRRLMFCMGSGAHYSTGSFADSDDIYK